MIRKTTRADGGRPGSRGTIGTGCVDLLGPDLLRRLGLAEPGDSVSFLPLVAGLEQRNAFKPLQDVSLGGRGTGAAETGVL